MNCIYFSTETMKCILNRDWGLCEKGKKGADAYLYSYYWKQCEWYKQEQKKGKE